MAAWRDGIAKRTKMTERKIRFMGWVTVGIGDSETNARIYRKAKGRNDFLRRSVSDGAERDEDF